ncbi:MAG: CDP-diacylglycerol--glycerol-3-phosphate 3-phosphatidyltransferase [Clostridia bacterium]|nr:CDP-diacylglycerol--glycerol-3-phosphate 3-phosphatidyltransferase [Clostridia bacterium]
MKLNLPNKLTLIRAVLVPFFIIFMIYPIFGTDHITWSRIFAAAIFILASLTDFFDGKIARMRGLVTSFGKFMDPLADKFMIFAALIAVLFSAFIFPTGNILSHGLLSNVFFWMSIIIIFRELTVTSLRLVVSGDANIVIPANIWGKMKTVSQIICIIVVILEPIVSQLGGFLSLISMLVATFFTAFSGYKYIKEYWKYIDPTK